MATAAHGLSSFSSYQCAAAAKAVFSAATVTHVVAQTHAVAVTVVVTTPAVAKLKIRKKLPQGAFFFV